MLANQPKNDTLYIKGFNIVVENRAFTYRQVAQNVGQKVCLMPAHYGYLQNNPKVGVFVGAFPENDTVYLINQKAQGGYFDKHIAMFGFLSEQQAVDTYQKCFEYGYIGLMSVIPCTIEQLKWWLANGDKSRPVTKERLPYAGLERLDSVIWGGQEGTDLASHGGQVAKLLYQIRQSDNFNHALEPLSYHDLTQELGNQGFVYENYDALVIEYNKLERKAKQLLMAMQGAADIVKPVGVAVSKPLTKGGVANVIAWFEMDDGQAVGVFFHNPDKTPKKIDPTDEMISYKWVLNKKDITIVVAPENGKDLVVRTVAKRIMKLVDANHDRFLKANSDKAELNQKEQSLGQLVIEKQSQLDALNDDIKALEGRKESNSKGISENGDYSSLTFSDEKQNFVKITVYLENDNLPKIGDYIITEYNTDKRTKDAKSIGSVVGYGGNYDKILDVYANDDKNIYSLSLFQRGIVSKRLKKEIADLEAKKAEKEAKQATKSPQGESEPVEIVAEEDAISVENITPTQERPADYRTNLANARAVAKSLGIETKGKKLVDLLTEIDQKDTEPKATTVSNKKSVDNALSRKETERQEAESRAEVEGMTNNHKELDARIDALDSKALGYLGAFLNYNTTDISKIAEKAKLEHPDDLKAALDKLDDAMAQDEIRQKLAQIEKQPNREDALALAIKLTKEMPDEAEKIRMSLSLAIATNKWKGIEVKLPQQSPKLKTDAEVLASIKRLQKSFEGTEFRLNISKANTDYIKGVLIKGTGSSMSSQEFSYFNNKGFDLGYIEYRNQFDLDTFNPILKAIEKWLQGETVPKFSVGTDVNWDIDSISTPLKIKEALDKALAEGLAIAKQSTEAEPTPATSEPKQPVSEPVVQTGARYESPKELFLKKANKAYKDLEDNGLKGFAKRANDVVQDVASNIVSLEDAEKRLNGIIYESENPLVSGEWRDLGNRKVYFWEDMRYGEIVDTRKTEGRSKNVSNPWRTGDGKLFESLPVAKKHELEAVSKYKFINDGYMQKTKSSETQQPESEPPMTNPDRDYLQSIIDGQTDALAVDIDAIIALAEKYDGDAEMNPLIDQALEVINQAEIEAGKGI